jgi:hypothetical protein
VALGVFGFGLGFVKDPVSRFPFATGHVNACKQGIVDCVRRLVCLFPLSGLSCFGHAADEFDKTITVSFGRDSGDL